MKPPRKGWLSFAIPPSSETTTCVSFQRADHYTIYRCGAPWNRSVQTTFQDGCRKRTSIGGIGRETMERFSERVVRAAKGRNKRRKMTRKNSIYRRKSPRTARTAGKNQGLGLMTESYATSSVPSSGLRYGLGIRMEKRMVVMHRLCTTMVGIPTADGQEGRKGANFFLLVFSFLKGERSGVIRLT